MNSCKDGCKHAVFCETWGEYKCLKKKRHISLLLSGCYCGEYEKGTCDISECHCEACEGRVKDNDD